MHNPQKTLLERNLTTVTAQTASQTAVPRPQSCAMPSELFPAPVCLAPAPVCLPWVAALPRGLF